MTLDVLTIDAFSKDGRGGNPAGVVVDAASLSDAQMADIARKVGFSETAFVLPSDRATYRVRFFTPASEIDLCGHATVATWFLLAKLGGAKPGTHSQETKAGLLGIEILPDGTILMEQALPTYSELVDPADVAASLGLRATDLADGFPVQVVSTGVRDVIVPVKDHDALLRIAPDLKAVARISAAHRTSGYHVFTLDARHGGTAACRNFAPLEGIDEEAATGTASGALSCYLHAYRETLRDGMRDRVFEQGWGMNRPSEIKSRLEFMDGAVTRVVVGGVAANQGSKRVSI